jgi:hypothetical protein
MYIQIKNNEVVGKSNTPQELSEGFTEMEYFGQPDDQLKLVDGVLVVKIDEEILAENDVFLLSAAWDNLRNKRNNLLRDTDPLVVVDRPVVDKVTDYRTMLRDLPSTHDDVTILTQSTIPSFEDWKLL